ncbi:hypothetical protein SATMO3_38610 [Sporomusa aerivorans]
MKIAKLNIGLFVFTFYIIFMFSNSAFASVETITLRQGDVNEAVYALQNELKKYGFYQYDVDGKFGLNTRLAVVQFQQAVGIEEDGIVGASTWQALRNYSGNSDVSRGRYDRSYGGQIAAFAQKFLGVPYVWGGSAASGFDCSGFIYYVFSNHGITLPRMADEQYNFGRHVSAAEIQPGDLVFYSTYTPGPSHVGIYVGNGQFIHASSAAGEVTLTAMSKPYYQARFLGAFRIIR